MRLCGFMNRWSLCGGVSPFRVGGDKICTTLSRVIDSVRSRGRWGDVAVIRKGWKSCGSERGVRLWSECIFFIVSGRVGWARCIFVHKGEEGLEIRTFCISISVCGGRARVME